jgi:hypothetical protein
MAELYYFVTTCLVERKAQAVLQNGAENLALNLISVSKAFRLKVLYILRC